MGCCVHHVRQSFALTLRCTSDFISLASERQKRLLEVLPHLKKLTESKRGTRCLFRTLMRTPVTDML